MSDRFFVFRIRLFGFLFWLDCDFTRPDSISDFALFDVICDFASFDFFRDFFLWFDFDLAFLEFSFFNFGFGAVLMKSSSLIWPFLSGISYGVSIFWVLGLGKVCKNVNWRFLYFWRLWSSPYLSSSCRLIERSRPFKPSNGSFSPFLSESEPELRRCWRSGICHSGNGLPNSLR